ncbi:hypothetical protein A2U01_0001030 [Trifolium medium]|uniref:CCHC-type domain-containing protein n=1 Tax=Trifolium medium TaxID=97028 RepID=A0A392M0Z1_9FABA|nr:hypothetical protein [Trifolium medium]
MAENSHYLQPTVPKFDDYYEHWSMLMENLLRSKEFWPLIENGVTTAPANATTEQVRLANESKLNDLKEAMKRKYQGTTKVKRAQFQAIRREFELLEMKESESVDEYFSRTLTIANRMTASGETVQQVTIVEKILRSLAPRFNYVVCSIEQSTNVTELSVEELQSSLLVQEQRMRGQQESSVEQALKISNGGRGAGNGRGRGRARGRGGRGRQHLETIECFKCHKLGHYQNSCPNWGDNVNYTEFYDEEETLLMARTEKDHEIREETWYLDSSYSNHMIGQKDWLYDFDSSFKDSVKLGNDTKMPVLGKGNVKLFINGKIHVISNVYYLPGLTTNLLSVGQLQEKKVTIVFKNNMCKGYHDEKGLIFSTQMTANRIYGHLSVNGLKLLTKLGMVNGLPELGDMEGGCTDCLSGKQQKEAIPKQAKWRAIEKLQLIHSDICGPINPSSNGGKRVFGCIAFAHIPDSQRKKLDNKSIKCVHLGISDESKAYKLYNPVDKRIIISRDVVFDESKAWNWDNKRKESDGNEVLFDSEEITATNDELIGPQITHEPHDSPLSNSDMDIGYESTDAEDEVAEEDSNQLGPRIKRLPSHFKDFVMGSEVDNEQELQNFAIYSSSEDPYTYDEACEIPGTQ